MKTVLLALAACTVMALPSIASAHPHHGHQICSWHHHHRVCHW